MQGAAGEHCSQRPTKTLQCSCVNVPALYIIYTYIVQPLGAYKTQLGGTYISSLLFYMVNVYCDYTSLCNYKYIISFFVSIYCWCFCTSDAFHIRIRKDCSEQCVNHLKRCKTSKFGRGQWPTHESTANEATHELGGYRDWSSRRTCSFVKSNFRQWQPAKPRAGMSMFSNSFSDQTRTLGLPVGVRWERFGLVECTPH